MAGWGGGSAGNVDLAATTKLAQLSSKEEWASHHNYAGGERRAQTNVVTRCEAVFCISELTFRAALLFIVE